MLRKRNRNDLIMEILRDELARKPDDRDAFDQLINTLRREGDIPGAIAACEKAVKASPNNKWYALVLEQLRKQAGNTGKPAGPERF